MNVSETPNTPAADAFPSWERVDTGPLSWVMSELRESLDRSLESLKTFAMNTDDPTPLKLAKSNLHQAHGALQIVDLEGVSLITEEIESLLESFEATPHLCTPEAVDTVASAYRSVTEYLEELLAGSPHQPVRLFPSYRALLALRNADRIHPADLFYPDLSVRPPRDSSGTGRLLSPAEIAVQRSRFERGLLLYLRDEKNMDAAAEMSAAVTVIESSPKQGQQRAFWWVTRAFFEALSGKAVPADLNVKRLCARINLQIRRLLDGSGTVAERLLRDTLFFVARSAPISKHIEEVKTVYSLDHSLPADFETERYGRINFGALRGAKDALASAKTAWSQVVSGDVGQISGFARDASSLLAATGSLGRPGLAHLAQVVASLATELSFDPRKPAENVGLDVATALLFLESALDQVRSLDEAFDARAEAVVARVEASAIGASVEGADVPWLDEISRQAQERLTMASFISEMQANLRNIEKSLDAFFRDPTQRAELPQAEKLLNQIGGALSVLGHEQAGQAIDKGRESIKRFAEPSYEPDPVEFGRVAESLGAVGFYIESLQHRADVGTVFRFDPETGSFSADLARGPAQKKVSEEDPDSDPEPRGPGGASPPSGPDPAKPESSVEQEIARHGDLVAQLAETLRAHPTDDATRQQLNAALHRVQQDALLVDDSSLKDRAAQALKVLHETSSASSEDLTASVFDLTDQTHRFGEAWEQSATAPIPEVTAPVPESGTSVDAELLEIFLTEAVEVLDTARHSLVQLSAQPADREQQTVIRRAYHTLKGSGRMVGLDAFGEGAWAIEQTLNQWLGDAKPASPDLITLLKRANDELDGWVTDLSELGYSLRLPNALIVAAEAVRSGRALDEPPPSPPLPDVGTKAVAPPALAATPAPLPAPTKAPLSAPPLSGEPTEVVAPLRTMEIASEDYMETEVLASSLQARATPALVEPAVGTSSMIGSQTGTHLGVSQFAPVEPTLKQSEVVALSTSPVEPSVPGKIAPAMEIATEDYMATEVLAGRLNAERPVTAPPVVPAAQTPPVPGVAQPSHEAAGLAALAAGALATVASEFATPAALHHPAVPQAPTAPTAPIAPHAPEPVQRAVVPPAPDDSDGAFMTTEVMHDDLDDEHESADEPSSLGFDFLPVTKEPIAPSAPLAPSVPHSMEPTPASVPPLGESPAHEQAGENLAGRQAANYRFDVDPVPAPPAQAPTVLPFAIPAPSRTDELKQIGPLTLSVPLYNIYLSEADELLRTLTHDFGEWRHELHRHVSEAAVRAAHSLSGTSATIGLTAVHDLAYAVESVLQVLHRTPAKIGLDEISLLQDGVEGLRAMLHRFAAETLPDPDVSRVARLFALRDEIKSRQLYAEPVNHPVLPAAGTDLIATEVSPPEHFEPEHPAPSENFEEHVLPTFVPAGQAILPDHVEHVPQTFEPVAQVSYPVEQEHVPPTVAPIQEASIPVHEEHLPFETGTPAQVSSQGYGEHTPPAFDALGDANRRSHDAFAPPAFEPSGLTSTPDHEPPAPPAQLAPPHQIESAPQTWSSAVPHDPHAPIPAEHSGSTGGAGIDDWQAELPEFGDEPLAAAAPVTTTVPELHRPQSTEIEPVAPQVPNPALQVLQATAAQASVTALALEAVSHVRDEIDPELIEIFLQEASEYLPQIGGSLRHWQADPRDLSHPQALLRQMHTIKGSARMAGAMRLGELVHNMETRVEWAVNLREIPQTAFEDLLAAHDRALELYDGLVHPRVEVQTERRAVRRLAELEEPDAASGETTGAAREVQQAGTAQAFAAHRAQPGAAVAPAGAAQVTQAVRVRADVLDRLVNQAGEVSISRSRLENEVGQIRSSLSDLTENLGRLRGQLREIEIQAETQMQSQLSMAKERERFDPLEFDRFTRLQELTRMMAESVNDVATVHQNLLRSLDGANRDLMAQQRMTRDLQQDLMRVRMVPFSSISERLYRLVRQTGKELDKRVNLDIRGGGVEIDRSVLERMIAPFEHILRNAIVHGIEARGTRVEKGKAETGELLVEVRQEGNEIVLVFSDDGAGLNLERIREKGRQAGLIGRDEDIADARASDLIFQPGFTTAQEVTELAGRGVGMDVVRSEAGGLGGRVSVDSEPAKGTRFTINLPLTLAVTQVVLVNVAGRTYALPSVLVEQVQQLRPQPLAQAYNDGQIVWLGQPVKLHFLAGLLGEKDRAPIAQRYSPLLILRSGGERIAVHVDEVVGNQEVVVKNIGPQLARMIGIAGATVLGSGDIVLILNPVQLAQQALRERPQLLASEPLVGGAIAELIDVPARAEPVAGLETLPIVMVVDDSLTVRRVTQRLLMREGYQVVLAKDGVDALQQLQDYTPDVMLVDIEMPRMDGFDLTRNIRSDERYQKIPIIMITSRTAEKHRSFALELGVDVYLGKPYQEDELLQHLARFVGTHKRATA